MEKDVREGGMMFQVSEKASEMIKDYLKDKEANLTVRVMMHEGGWSGPSLGLTLDESHDDDEVFTDREVTYVMDRTLFDRVKPVAVDYVSTPRGSGFKLSSNMDAGAGCGTSCSC